MADQVTGILSRLLRYLRFSSVLPYIKEPVFDFGCGTGNLCEYFSPNSYIGYDNDDKSIEIALKKHPKHSFVSDLHSSKINTSQFNSIVLLAVIEHLKDSQNALKELSQRISDDGKIIITTPNASFERFLYWGSKIKLFSAHAYEDHSQYFDADIMTKLAKSIGLTLVFYKKFMFGANQIFILEKEK